MKLEIGKRKIDVVVYVDENRRVRVKGRECSFWFCDVDRLRVWYVCTAASNLYII
ncbi:hypothetical protein MtrunA17_Chr2g0294371 [Medicago truncatula]|uniref:Uncharacterized protein n=1 Tax=Medicago truncatula TaxID=3880 RepID=A0A396J9A3_MEDTR|nr:hypothetical protein MtrunA17_Chr2g0294371 [Medicago truncatula]